MSTNAQETNTVPTATLQRVYNLVLLRDQYLVAVDALEKNNKAANVIVDLSVRGAIATLRAHAHALEQQVYALGVKTHCAHKHPNISGLAHHVKLAEAARLLQDVKKDNAKDDDALGALDEIDSETLEEVIENACGHIEYIAANRC